MKIIKFGGNRKKRLYFICNACNTEFTAWENECVYHDYGNQYDNGYSCDCPICGQKCVGLTRRIYEGLRIKGGNINE